MHRLLSSSRLHLAWEDPLAQLILDWVHLKQERLPSLVIISFFDGLNGDIQIIQMIMIQGVFFLTYIQGGMIDFNDIQMMMSTGHCPG